jgi:fucose permease
MNKRTSLLCAGFFLIGIVTVMLGQILPVLSARFSLDDRTAGYLFLIQFAGALSGTLFFNRLIRTVGYSRMLFGGFCMMAFGSAAVNSGVWFWCTTAIATYGIGIGLTIPAINVLTVELDRERSASALSLVNFFWGVGAIVCKPFIDHVGSPENISPPTLLLSASLFLLGLLIGFTNFGPNAVHGQDLTVAPIRIWKTATAWLIAGFNFLHIGVESSVGGWVTTYQTRLTETSSSGWISAAVLYFFMLVVGRGVAPIFLSRIGENTALFSSLVLMTSGVILVLLTNSLAALLAGSAILGFGCASVFPTNMSRFARVFGPQATQNAMPLFILGSLGGAFVTWLVGFVSTGLDSLRSGFMVIMVTCFLLIALQIVLTRMTSQTSVAQED